jgi:hypothetical protein
VELLNETFRSAALFSKLDDSRDNPNRLQCTENIAVLTYRTKVIQVSVEYTYFKYSRSLNVVANLELPFLASSASRRPRTNEHLDGCEGCLEAYNEDVSSSSTARAPA